MITSLELLAGARTQRETKNLDLVLSGYRAIPPNEDIARLAYYVVKTYARSHGLDALDALIAATALEEGLTLATAAARQLALPRSATRRRVASKYPREQCRTRLLRYCRE